VVEGIATHLVCGSLSRVCCAAGTRAVRVGSGPHFARCSHRSVKKTLFLLVGRKIFFPAQPLPHRWFTVASARRPPWEVLGLEHHRAWPVATFSDGMTSSLCRACARYLVIRMHHSHRTLDAVHYNHGAAVENQARSAPRTSPV
jgi:hypothetical protein